MLEGRCGEERKGKGRGGERRERKGGDPQGWFTSDMFEILKISCSSALMFLTKFSMFTMFVGIKFIFLKQIFVY